MIWRGLFLLLALVSGFARADTPLTLFKTFTGNVNFTGTVATMRNSSFNYCSVYGANTTLSVALAGIPTSATVLSAQLYWAGSGENPDYTVGFESGNVTATTARRYTSSSIGSNFDYFSGAVDVTPQVVARRNGNYQFYGLTVDTGYPYCGSSAVLSGFSLLVVYSDAAQPYRTLNVYEGFQYFRNTSYTTTMTGFRIPSPLSAAMTGRIGHITWEGDPSGVGSEDFSFNGSKMTDNLNPAGNQFNSQSGINGNTASYGVDFDDYDVTSPVIQPGQTSATTLYQSGNDLVLLSAQILAVPTTPAVDLVLTMTRSGAFLAGTAGSYTLSVYNAGANTEVGPITLVDTLPAGVSYVSATGTRWTCSAAGQVVTCKYNGLFTPNTYLPDITLTVLPTAEGTITNTATASGVNYDNVPANNSDSDTTTVTKGSVTYVFTDSACKPNVALGAAGQCNVLGADQRVPAATSVDGYLTALSSGVPVARSTTASTTVPINFAITCVLPLKNANVQATINTVTVPLCADGPAAPAAGSTAWSAAIPLVFAANAPSSKITMFYADVGKVLISLKDAAGLVASSPTVIWRPDSLVLSVDGMPAKSTSAPFRAAGVPFAMKVHALMINGNPAPNFGNGDATVGVALPGTWPTASDDEKLIAAAMGTMSKVDSSFPDRGSGGVFTGTGTYYEVGVPTLVASITGGYFGVSDVRNGTLKVGRFYPFSFQTKVTPVFLKCTDIPLTCVTGAPGAAYATQPFDVQAVPIDALGAELNNFRGIFGRDIVLSAFDSAGGSTPNPPAAPAGAKLSEAKILALTATDTNAALRTSATYSLPVPFSRTAPANSAWTVPTPIFLRATSLDTKDVLTVTSKQSGTSLEGGITILNGRLRLTTVPGSELLRLPVTEEAQFWKPGSPAGAWTNNLADNSATPTAIAFSACKRNLLVSNACFSGLQMTPKDPVFTKGTARFFIAAPGAGRTGSAMFNMTGAPAWLPSTLTQAVFGIYKSNFIYLRELY